MMSDRIISVQHTRGTVMKKFLLIGDSIMKGVIYSDQTKRYKLCDDFGYDTVANENIEINNNSQMGATIDVAIKKLEKLLPEDSSETTVLLEFGGNDCEYNWKTISDDPASTIDCKTPAKLFCELYTDAVRYARSKGAKVILSTLIPIDSERYMNWITRNLNYDNIFKWLHFDLSTLSRWQEYYNSLVEEIARKLYCPIVDLRSDFLASRSYRELICADGIHPTQEGHNLIHRKISNLITECAQS